MKPKVLRSVRSKDSDGHKGNYVELLKDGETYIVRHKLSTMQKTSECKYETSAYALVDFMSYALFILHDPLLL